MRGMTLIDVIVGTAIMLTVFLSIFGAFKLSIDLVYSTKAKAGAVALVADRLEYIRGLPYDSVGTAGGIPAGGLPQVATSSLNGLTYTLTTLVQYVDDPSDGTGDADSNAITADYKTVKVEANWVVRSSPRSTFAVTTITPVGLETLASGGTLRVNAIDALAAPVAGATVRIVNASTTPAIDVSVETNDAGTASFPGAPTAGGYQVTVTKSGYSTAQTYGSTVENPNPSPGHVAVADHLTSTVSLAIDRMGILRTATFSPAGSATTTGTLVIDGSALSDPVSPQYLVSWDTLTFTPSEARIRLFSLSDGAYVEIPDAALPGNGAGFMVGPVSLAGLSSGVYGSLKVGGTIESAASSTVPWALSYIAGPTPLPTVALSIHGAKIIGTTAASSPIYKYSGSVTTDSTGLWLIDPIEWDTYTLVPTGSYDVIERCPDSPVVAPGVDTPLALTLVPHTTHSVKVYVAGSGAALAGASVELGRSGATTTATTSACGQAFFGSLVSGDYTVMASKSGFQPTTQSMTVSGTAEITLPLTP